MFYKEASLEKGERNVKVEVSLRGVCLYAKCFRLGGDAGGWRRGKEAAWNSGLYLLQLGRITKLLPWASLSKRLTNPKTEPVIPHKEIGNCFLLEERGIPGRRGVLVESHLLSGENCELGFFLCCWLWFFSHL